MEMQNPKLAGGKPTESTQKYLDIAEIRDNIIVLKDGSLRGVIAVSSTNFSLKSEEEQNGLTSAYQNFLNSLDFPIQILMNSRVLDINSYLEKLRTLAAGQTNELLRIQMAEYIEYIAKLIEFASIMSKNFYVIVPYSAQPVKETWGSKIRKVFNPVAGIAVRQGDFDKAKIKLDERLQHVTGELGTMGLRSIVLGTEELIELVYQSYNLGASAPLNTGEVEELELEK
ncbi:hypothetical protein D4R52_03760 [bacterium]|nr:MAG: hypothetical protein D4R52_03760 [bacterium]